MHLFWLCQFALVLAINGRNEESPIGDMKLCYAPSSVCPNKDIKYYLFTSKTRTQYELSISEQTTDQILCAPFLIDRPLKILLPGAQAILTSDIHSLLLIPAYLKSLVLNVVYVEYTKYSNVTFCPLVHTTYLAECIAQVLLNIYKYLPTFKPENTHIIGGSMGSLVSGRVGSHFNGSIYRITVSSSIFSTFKKLIPPSSLVKLSENKYNLIALDPPEYWASIYQSPVVYNLSPNVAKIVDVYHTNMGHLGIWKTVGTVDVIFNKGEVQPQCYNDSMCSHRIVIYYYMLTIVNRKAFWAQPCIYRLYDYLTNEVDQICAPITDQDGRLVGEYMSPETKGTFLVHTRPEYVQGKLNF